MCVMQKLFFSRCTVICGEPWKMQQHSRQYSMMTKNGKEKTAVNQAPSVKIGWLIVAGCLFDDEHD